METRKQKYCLKCKQWKPIIEFNKNKGKADGLQGQCKICCKEYRIAHREEKKKYNIAYRIIHHEELVNYNLKHREERNKNKKKWCRNNQEHVHFYNKEYNSNYRKTHKEEIKAYRKEHSEEIARSKKLYNTSHLKERMKQQKEYRSKNPGKVIINRHLYRSRKFNAEGGGITEEQWEQIKRDHNYLCVYCNKKKKLGPDHLIPLSKKGRHDIDNIVPACRNCNSQKNDMSLLRFLYQKSIYISGRRVNENKRRDSEKDRRVQG